MARIVDTPLYWIIILIGIYILFRILKRLFRGKPKRRIFRIKRKKVFLTAKTKAKAEGKYNMLLAKYKRKHKREPSKNDLFRIVIAASHHTFPVKGRNVRRWTKGKIGHWNRQKVRKYLLEKHDIVDNFRMK